MVSICLEVCEAKQTKRKSKQKYKKKKQNSFTKFWLEKLKMYCQYSNILLVSIFSLFPSSSHYSNVLFQLQMQKFLMYFRSFMKTNFVLGLLVSCISTNLLYLFQ